MTVPLVGQSFQIVTAFSTAIIQCQCEAKSVLVLQGRNRVSACPVCGKQFAIAKSSDLQIGEVVPDLSQAVQ